MASSHSSEADRPITPKAWRFLVRLTAVTAGGMFIDGYVFAVIAVTMALRTFKTDLHMTTGWAGLVSSSTLIGIFGGAAVFGYVTDRAGRRVMFLADLACFSLASILLFFVQQPWQLFVLGLLMGLAIGAEYAIGSPLVSEFAPTNLRARLTSFLQIAWNIGYVVAFLIGYLVTRSYPEAWRWVLASALIPAVICLVARRGLPESPRWLLARGRRGEAESVLAELDWKLDTEDFGRETPARTHFRVIFSRDHLGRTVFVCVFWLCLVMPYFAIIFFQADVLTALKVTNPIAAALLGTIVALAGTVAGWLLVERIGRRKLLIVPLWITGLALFVVAFDNLLPKTLVAICFFTYLFCYGVGSILCGVYPMELFPTSVRTTGVGLASSVSRVGSAIGTYLFPMLLASWGIGATMAVMGAVCVAGAVVSQFMAPETTGRTLSEVSSAEARGKIRFDSEVDTGPVLDAHTA